MWGGGSCIVSQLARSCHDHHVWGKLQPQPRPSNAGARLMQLAALRHSPILPMGGHTQAPLALLGVKRGKLRQLISIWKTVRPLIENSGLAPAFSAPIPSLLPWHDWSTFFGGRAGRFAVLVSGGGGGPALVSNAPGLSIWFPQPRTFSVWAGLIKPVMCKFGLCSSRDRSWVLHSPLCEFHLVGLSFFLGHDAPRAVHRGASHAHGRCMGLAPSLGSLTCPWEMGHVVCAEVGVAIGDRAFRFSDFPRGRCRSRDKPPVYTRCLWWPGCRLGLLVVCGQPVRHRLPSAPTHAYLCVPFDVGRIVYASHGFVGRSSRPPPSRSASVVYRSFCMSRRLSRLCPPFV